jgi:hypothetical protein
VRSDGTPLLDGPDSPRSAVPASAAVAAPAESADTGPPRAAVAASQDAPLSTPLPAAPVSPPPAPPATPPAPCSTTAASGSYASGSGQQHGLAGLPLAVLGTEISAPTPAAVALRWVDVPGEVVGGGDDPGSSPD